MRPLDHLSFLLSGDFSFSRAWSPKEWQHFIDWCWGHQLETFLYHQLKENDSHTCPSLLVQRLKNQFEICFAHQARRKFEVDTISFALQEKSIPFCFIKGYPLARDYYPHSVCRKMQDIDCVCDPKDHRRIAEIFQKHHYSLLPKQSELEEKPCWVKLWGPHAFAFEFHRSFYTSYQKDPPPLLSFHTTPDPFPSPEILFLSVLFHHKFFESSLRDLIDLHFILKKQASFDWGEIERYSRSEKLYKHFLLQKELSEALLGDSWAIGPLQKKTSFRMLYRLKRHIALPRKNNRRILHKICDAFCLWMVYDDWKTSWRCFLNKYILYVSKRKYRGLQWLLRVMRRGCSVSLD